MKEFSELHRLVAFELAEKETTEEKFKIDRKEGQRLKTKVPTSFVFNIL